MLIKSEQFYLDVTQKHLCFLKLCIPSVVYFYNYILDDTDK